MTAKREKAFRNAIASTRMEGLSFSKNRSRTVCAIWTVILTPPPSSVRFCGSHRTLRPRGNAYALYDRPIFCRLLSLYFRPYQ